MSHTKTDEPVAVAIVNYNTAETLAHLLFSLFRVVGHSRLAKIVVVDNGSTDDSVSLLEELSEAGLIEVIFNRKQHYYGPALNQTLDYLSARRRLAATHADCFTNVWVLDSDTIVLRREVVSEAQAAMRETGAGMLGQFQYDALREGYAHPSALFLNLEMTFLTGQGRFDDSGAPATKLHRALRDAGITIANFPIFEEGYVLHIGRATRRDVWNRQEQTNRHFQGAANEPEPHYHGHPHGQQLQRGFLELFHSEVPEFSPAGLVAACLREELSNVSVSERTTQM